MSSRGRIALATFGTYGDLHPFIAIALRLRDDGFEPVIATGSAYRHKVESEGIEFRRLSPEQEDVERDLGLTRVQLLRKVVRHPEFVLCGMLLPYLRESYDDSLAAIGDADLVVTHTTALATKLAAEKLQRPHLGVALQPMAFLSPYDPPELPPAAALMRWLYARGLPWRRAVVDLIKRRSRPWAAPIDRLRAEVGLPVSRAHPFFEAQFTSEGAIALYSSVLGGPQPDHPLHTQIVGFAFYDAEAGGASSLDARLTAFIRNADAPVVFTLGTSAVHDAHHFVTASLAAVAQLRCRAVFVLDDEQRIRWQSHNSDRVMFCRYAPYSLLFPHAAVVVHHGGVGTTAQALRSGRPQLIVPYLVDQPDNAARVQRLGAGRALSMRQYRPQRVVRVLRELRTDSHVTQCAQAAAQRIGSEDGAGAAARIISEVLARSTQGRDQRQQ